MDETNSSVFYSNERMSLSKWDAFTMSSFWTTCVRIYFWQRFTTAQRMSANLLCRFWYWNHFVSLSIYLFVRLSFSPCVRYCSDNISCTAQPFLTQLGMAVYYHEAECSVCPCVRLSFCPCVRFCPDNIPWTAQPFLTQLDMAVYYHEAEWSVCPCVRLSVCPSVRVSDFVRTISPAPLKHF